jgi:hypothetical protein
MSFWEYQPEEYEQFFLSKQDKIVEEALSTPNLKVSEYELTIKTDLVPDKLSIYLEHNNKTASIWLLVDSDCLAHLRSWMEDMSDYSSMPSRVIRVIWEDISFIISYTHLGSVSIDGHLEPIALIAYLGWDFAAKLNSLSGDSPFSSLIVPIRSFLSDLYYGILEKYPTNISSDKSHNSNLRDQFRSIKSRKLENNLSVLESIIG